MLVTLFSYRLSSISLNLGVLDNNSLISSISPFLWINFSLSKLGKFLNNNIYFSFKVSQFKEIWDISCGNSLIS